MAARGDIPGFYYDSEKGRYFKKQPGHFASSPAVPCPTPPAAASVGRTPSLYQTLRTTSHTIQPCTRSVYRSLVCSVECAEEKRLDAGASYSGLATSKSGGVLATVYTTAQQQTSVCVYKLGESLSQLCELFQEHNLQPTSPYGNVMDFCCRDGSDVVLLLKQSVASKQVLCFRLGDCTLQSNSARDLSPRCVLTAVAGSSTGPLGAVGLASGKVCTLSSQPSAPGVWLTPPRSSPVFSLAFTPLGQSLFAGYRNGSIIEWDMRELRRSCAVMEPGQGSVKSAVISLHAMRDGNYLISSALNSHLGVWDMRMRRVVWRFAAHVNHYQPCSTALGWEDSLLCASGSDGVVRVWSLTNGEVVRTIPTNALSHVSFSESSCNHQPAIFISSEQKLQLFKL